MNKKSITIISIISMFVLNSMQALQPKPMILGCHQRSYVDAIVRKFIGKSQLCFSSNLNFCNTILQYDWCPEKSGRELTAIKIPIKNFDYWLMVTCNGEQGLCLSDKKLDEIESLVDMFFQPQFTKKSIKELISNLYTFGKMQTLKLISGIISKYKDKINGTEIMGLHIDEINPCIIETIDDLCNNVFNCKDYQTSKNCGNCKCKNHAIRNKKLYGSVSRLYRSIEIEIGIGYINFTITLCWKNDKGQRKCVTITAKKLTEKATESIRRWERRYYTFSW